MFLADKVWASCARESMPSWALSRERLRERKKPQWKLPWIPRGCRRSEWWVGETIAPTFSTAGDSSPGVSAFWRSHEPTMWEREVAVNMGQTQRASMWPAANCDHVRIFLFPLFPFSHYLNPIVLENSYQEEQKDQRRWKRRRGWSYLFSLNHTFFHLSSDAGL